MVPWADAVHCLHVGDTYKNKREELQPENEPLLYPLATLSQ